MKRFLAIALAFLFLLSAPIYAVAAAIGDLDGNGKAEAKDYVMLKRSVLGTYNLTPEQTEAADVDGNGKIEAKDYVMLKRAVLGTYTLRKKGDDPVIEPVSYQVPARNAGILDISSVPAYQGEEYLTLSDNIPNFREDELTTKSYEYYCELDTLGRCVYAVACVGKDIMPTSSRGSISSVIPSGWNDATYEITGGENLYSRAHLIAFQLTGENANERNLITGTKYMNTAMIPYETKISDYINKTGNHVLYRVTPIFAGNNLVANGVHMEAMSVEDNGQGVCFNIYLYNIQPGIIINYRDGTSEIDEENAEKRPEAGEERDYVLNTNNHKFHYPGCSSVLSIKESNKKAYHGTREALIESGYVPCKNCNP